MQKKLVLSLCLLSGALSATSAMAVTRGSEVLRSQLQTLNTCIKLYMNQAEEHAMNTGGDCSSSIDFQTDAGGMCSTVVKFDATSIDPNCVLTISTPDSGVQPPLRGQTFVLNSYINTDNTTPYDASMHATGIVGWTIGYTPAATADLCSMNLLGSTGHSYFSSLGSPLNAINCT